MTVSVFYDIIIYSKETEVEKTVIIKSVESGSLAQKAGILDGDVLVSVNGNEISDVLDYRFYLASSHLTVTVMRDGETLEFSVKKSTYADIGLEFDTPLMDKKKRCANKCIFCFIDQNPKGMRETIYFKDDDSRLSFLHGNYITLTNLFDKDVERIIKMRISPVRISVHTTDPVLRCEMMKNKRAGEVLSYLKRFADAGLELHCQIVLCRGVNDGKNLVRTLTDLLQYVPSLTSVSIVPAGLTRHRDTLFPLTRFTKEEAAYVIKTVNEFGDRCVKQHGGRIFYCSDEFYINAGLPIPSAEYYEEFSQLENGVGMLRSFEDEFFDELEYIDKSELSLPRHISVATGYASYEMILRLCESIAIDGLTVSVYPIVNRFYGDSVTVSGLLTGGDIADQLRGKSLGDELLIPANALRSPDDIFLDDMTLDSLRERLGVKITPTSQDGCEFLRALCGLNDD